MNKLVEISTIKNNILKYKKVLDYHKVNLKKYKDTDKVNVDIYNCNWNCKGIKFCRYCKNCVDCDNCYECNDCKKCHFCDDCEDCYGLWVCNSWSKNIDLNGDEYE